MFSKKRNEQIKEVANLINESTERGDNKFIIGINTIVIIPDRVALRGGEVTSAFERFMRDFFMSDNNFTSGEYFCSTAIMSFVLENKNSFKHRTLNRLNKGKFDKDIRFMLDNLYHDQHTASIRHIIDGYVQICMKEFDYDDTEETRLMISAMVYAIYLELLNIDYAAKLVKHISEYIERPDAKNGAFIQLTTPIQHFEYLDVSDTDNIVLVNKIGHVFNFLAKIMIGELIEAEFVKLGIDRELEIKAGGIIANMSALTKFAKSSGVDLREPNDKDKTELVSKRRFLPVDDGFTNWLDISDNKNIRLVVDYIMLLETNAIEEDDNTHKLMLNDSSALKNMIKANSSYFENYFNKHEENIHHIWINLRIPPTLEGRNIPKDIFDSSTYTVEDIIDLSRKILEFRNTPHDSPAYENSENFIKTLIKDPIGDGLLFACITYNLIGHFEYILNKVETSIARMKKESEATGFPMKNIIVIHLNDFIQTLGSSSNKTQEILLKYMKYIAETCTYYAEKAAIIASEELELEDADIEIAVTSSILDDIPGHAIKYYPKDNKEEVRKSVYVEGNFKVQ